MNLISIRQQHTVLYLFRTPSSEWVQKQINVLENRKLPDRLSNLTLKRKNIEKGSFESIPFGTQTKCLGQISSKGGLGGGGGIIRNFLAKEYIIWLFKPLEKVNVCTKFQEKPGRKLTTRLWTQMRRLISWTFNLMAIWIAHFFLNGFLKI